MSQENVALVRTLYAELGGASVLTATPDEVDLAFRDYLDDHLEIHLPAEYPEGEPVFRGREGFAQMVGMLRETWGQFRFEPERFLDAGDRVVVFIHVLAEGGASHVPVELETTHVWTIRGGRGIAVHAYRDRQRALEAAGLSE
jgi:ketosteroid isomerase-like protein